MAEKTYHQRMYPDLYTEDGILKSSLIPKVDYGGSGTGIDPLNLAGPGGKGTGMDLANGGINPLFETMVEDKDKLSEEVYDDQILREVKKPKTKKTNKKTEQEPGAINSTKMLEKELKEKAKEGDDEKSMLQKLFERYDLVSLGADIASGKGLVEGLRDQEASITQSKKDQAAALRQAALDQSKIEYNSALAQQAIAYAKKAGLPTKEIQNAQGIAKSNALGTGFEVGTAEFNEAYTKAFGQALTQILISAGDPLGLKELTNLGIIETGDPSAYLSGIIQQAQIQSGKTTDTTSIPQVTYADQYPN